MFAKKNCLKILQGQWINTRYIVSYIQVTFTNKIVLQKEFLIFLGNIRYDIESAFLTFILGYQQRKKFLRLLVHFSLIIPV